VRLRSSTSGRATNSDCEDGSSTNGTHSELPSPILSLYLLHLGSMLKGGNQKLDIISVQRRCHGFDGLGDHFAVGRREPGSEPQCTDFRNAE
jgi:hypothetical protein